VYKRQSQYASANYAFRANNDPLNILDNDTVYKAGLAPYNKTFGTTRNRWGDYSNTIVDPANDTDMWTLQEYAALPRGGSDRWGTWWGQLIAPPTPAWMIGPQPGSTLTGASATFTWSAGVGVAEYWIWIGTSPGTLNLYDANQGANTSATVTGLPINGATLYVRLFSWINGAWQYNDYTYTAASPSKAVMISPAPGSTLPGSTATFTWTQSGASEYWLWMGTAPGTLNLYDANQGANTSATVTGLPINGATLYVRLFSLINAAWQYNDYTYTAASPSKAVMVSPTPGSTLPGSTATFTWTQSGASEYWLWIGTSPGTLNLYDANQGNNTSATVTGLPINGATLYVRLFSLINAAWQYNDYTYTAASPSKAVMISPTPGSTLPSSTATFTWTQSGASEYWLWIGTSPGMLNLYDANQGTNTSGTVSGLPTNGGAIYVRLFSWINSAWQYNDYAYTAAKTP